MTDHDGWDHHDDPGYEPHDDVTPHPVDVDTGTEDAGTEDTWDEPYPDEEPEPPAELDPDPDGEPEWPAEPDPEVMPPLDAAVVGADPDAVPEPGDDGAPVFPPTMDVGPLPEPVDGFPWIDPGSLGVVDPATVPAAAVDDPDPRELAGYAAADLPPAQDPWDALAASDDPATAALARFYRPDVPG